RLESGEPLGQVRGEPALALLTVVDDVQTGFDLLADAVLDGFRGEGLEFLAVVGPAVFLGAHQLDQVIWPGDASRVRGQDPVCASLHRALSLRRELANRTL